MGFLNFLKTTFGLSDSTSEIGINNQTTNDTVSNQSVNDRPDTLIDPSWSAHPVK